MTQPIYPVSRSVRTRTGQTRWRYGPSACPRRPLHQREPASAPREFACSVLQRRASPDLRASVTDSRPTDVRSHVRPASTTPLSAVS